MTSFMDFEQGCSTASLAQRYDVIIIGTGAAGSTLLRELAGQGLAIAVLESGELKETSHLEELNRVEVCDELQASDLQEARQKWHGPQMKVWKPDTQRFGVRCRVLGGSTAAWAGKVAAFDEIDYEARRWVPFSNWPLGSEEMQPFLARAAAHLDLGPLVQGDAFWQSASRRKPAELGSLKNVDAFFWQFARSRHALTDVMRFGQDLVEEVHVGVTVFLNATAAAVELTEAGVSGVHVISSVTGRNRAVLSSKHVILAAGAIENARLLLLSKDASGRPLDDTHRAIGRYLMDHPSVEVGDFTAQDREKAASLLGFYPIQQKYRVFMYACGLALKPSIQRAQGMPNMASFASISVAADDPLQALSRLAKRQSRQPLADVVSVVTNLQLVTTSVGRKLLNYRRIPERIRRLAADFAVLVSANMVARNFVSKGRGRRLERVTLNIISEQAPDPANRITLAETTDRLGLRLPFVRWAIPRSLREDMIRFAGILKDDLEQAGITGFRLTEAFASGDARNLPICDMAHTAGSTRMGVDPRTSVVDADAQVHGIRGLYVAGASVFPTSGHANPTLVLMALAIRLADTVKKSIAATQRRRAASDQVASQPAAARQMTRSTAE